MGRAAAVAFALAAAALAAGQAVAAQPADEARQAQKRGVELRRAGDLEGALREFDRVIELVPGAALAWYNRGLVRRALGDCRAAIADFTRANDLEPGRFQPLHQRANCHQELGDYAAAVDDYTRAVNLPGRVPGRFVALYGRGDALRRLGRLDEAAADYTRVLEMRKDTKALRSRAWLSFYRGRWSEAHRDMARYLHETDVKEVDSAYAAIVAALALRRLGRHEEAAKSLSQWMGRLDSARWPRPILDYLRGGPEPALPPASAEAGRRTEALAYLGASLLEPQRSAAERERGVRLLREVLREGDPRYLEYDLAYYELARAGLAGPADRRERKTP